MFPAVRGRERDGRKDKSVEAADASNGCVGEYRFISEYILYCRFWKKGSEGGGGVNLNRSRVTSHCHMRRYFLPSQLKLKTTSI